VIHLVRELASCVRTGRSGTILERIHLTISGIMRQYSVRNLSGEMINAIMRMSRTRTNYWAELAIDGVLGVALMAEGLSHRDLSPAATLYTVVLGFFIFSFLEYCCHRWLFHGSLPLLKQGHAAHHSKPDGYDSLPFFIPPVVLIALTAAFTACMAADFAYLLSGAMAFGYVTYGISHFSIHHRRFRNPVARKWAAYHHIHHYHPDCNFGVTTPLWDVILRTSYIPKNRH
jgi:sterol desaturase/sphingolipid hydroxylase (fatty acid hydroxylase superfamily)